ncbi:MAG: 16S rRNA (uracil(1498)-N(3))-methyltransferase [FCB group bacterium]|nr:16S rRNA (uracil(1498)-N(3))-methyltransferase [FCB group bacterium]
MMQSFVYNREHLDGRDIIIDGSEARHMTSVLRLQKGDTVRLIDGQGTAHISEIVEAGSKKVLCRIIKTLKLSGEPSLSLTLAIGLSTGSKFDMVIEKGVEVGVSRFVPLITDRGKVKVGDSSAVTRKLNRWRRVAEAAVKQSGRSVFPTIETPIALDDFLKTGEIESSILFHPDETAKGLLSVVESLQTAKLTVIIGPESGFSSAEIELAENHNIPIVSLGPRILRTETAGIVLPALIIYHHKMVK